MISRSEPEDGGGGGGGGGGLSTLVFVQKQKSVAMKPPVNVEVAE